MKKSAERRSMTYALICYSRLGATKSCTTPFEVYMRIYGAWGRNRDIALDVWAIHECLMILRLQGDDESVSAINEIYLRPFSKRLTCKAERLDISDRVLRFAFDNNLDERTVYRRLKKARDLWLAIRSSADKTKK